MNTGTLSGFDVLTFGKIEPGAIVELKNGSSAEVVKVQGKRLTLHGVVPGSAQVKLLDGSEKVMHASSGDIVTVLRQPRPPASTDRESSAVSSLPRIAGV